MGVTTIDLYRSGNAGSARLDRVRVQPGNSDVDLFLDPATGEMWVLAANGEGVSTWDAVDPTWRGKPWRLPMGSVYPDSLRVWSNGVPGHWAWAPARTMLLSEYVAALATVTPLFKPA
jgi:hypothetical protein